MRLVSRWGILFVVVLGIAAAAFAHPGHDHEGGLTNGAILDSLNLAHAKLDAGDRPAARAELKALAQKLKGSADPRHRAIRRRAIFIAIELTVGLASSAEKQLHALIRDVSAAGTDPVPPDQPSPPAGDDTVPPAAGGAIAR
jgi:hypothetical protein